MTEEELRKDFETAYKIIRAERKMREFVFRGDPTKRDAKIAEMDTVLAVLTRFKDALKVQVNAMEQPTLLDVPRKAGYV